MEMEEMGMQSDLQQKSHVGKQSARDRANWGNAEGAIRGRRR